MRSEVRALSFFLFTAPFREDDSSVLFGHAYVPAAHKCTSSGTLIGKRRGQFVVGQTSRSKIAPRTAVLVK
jgi:hypothetical protein